MLTVQGGGDTIAQMVFPHAGQNIGYRPGNVVDNGSGAWQPWRYLYDTVNKPTPAEIGAEAVTVTGSNTNGYYVKYADGTMICYGRNSLGTRAITTAWGSWFISAPISRTYPVAFVGAPASVSVNMENTTGDLAVWVSAPSRTTGFDGYFTRGVSGTFICTMAWMAIGRWK